jgi:hypothetical protein
LEVRDRRKQEGMGGGKIRMKKSGSKAKARPMTNLHRQPALLPNTAHNITMGSILSGRFPGLHLRCDQGRDMLYYFQGINNMKNSQYTRYERARIINISVRKQ